jgi:prophage DNA circulation protein
MTNPVSVVNQDVLTENKMSINSIIKQSYSSAKKQLQEGMHVIQDGMNVIKDEFIEMYDKAGSYIHKMALPINNFLKDLGQIEAEFLQEIGKQSPVKTSTSGCIVPVEQALLSPMEENY